MTLFYVVLAIFFLIQVLASAVAFGIAMADGDDVGRRLMLLTGAVSVIGMGMMLWAMSPT